MKCTNYPDSKEVNDFDPFSSNVDGTLSEVTRIGTQMSTGKDNDDIVLQFVKGNSNADLDNSKEKPYYSQQKPNFTKTVNWISTQDEVDELKKIQL